MVDDSEGAAGEGGVAGALIFGGDFQHQHPGAMLMRRQGGAGRRIAGPDDDHVDGVASDCFHGLNPISRHGRT